MHVSFPNITLRLLQIIRQSEVGLPGQLRLQTTRNLRRGYGARNGGYHPARVVRFRDPANMSGRRSASSISGYPGFRQPVFCDGCDGQGVAVARAAIMGVSHNPSAVPRVRQGAAAPQGEDHAARGILTALDARSPAWPCPFARLGRSGVGDKGHPNIDFVPNAMAPRRLSDDSNRTVKGMLPQRFNTLTGWSVTWNSG